jgi:small subunit ribosomal protein S17
VSEASKSKENVGRTIRCTVTSDKMEKSRVAVVERLVKHPVFGKYIRQRTKLMFHDAKNVTRAGDEVLVRQTRPLSARKKFELVKVVREGRR